VDPDTVWGGETVSVEEWVYYMVVVIIEGEGAVLGRVNLGRPIVTSGNLLHSCAKLH